MYFKWTNPVYLSYQVTKKTVNFVTGFFKKKKKKQEVTVVTVNSNYIDEVICYTDSTTNWDATQGNPFDNNHIKTIKVYKGAEVNKISFSPALEA